MVRRTRRGSPRRWRWAANPDVETPEFYGGATRCDVIFDSDLLQMFMDEVVGWNGAPDPVPRYAEIADEVMGVHTDQPHFGS